MKTGELSGSEISNQLWIDSLKWFIVILKIRLPHYLTHNPSVYLFRDQQVRQDQWESEATLDPQDHPVNRVYLDLREKREQRCEQIHVNIYTQ